KLRQRSVGIGNSFGGRRLGRPLYRGIDVGAIESSASAVAGDRHRARSRRMASIDAVAHLGPGRHVANGPDAFRGAHGDWKSKARGPIDRLFSWPPWTVECLSCSSAEWPD